MLTVIGGSGFVGRHLIDELSRRGVAHTVPDRDASLDGRSLGDVVLCAGVTGDFRARPADAVDAHVGLLARLLRTCAVDSVVILSSTRIYRGERGSESDSIELDPTDPDRLYDASKLAAEALALASGTPALVLRLANVYGADPAPENFLADVLSDAVRDRSITLRTSLDSTRNYVSVDDVVHALLALMDTGARGIYNVAGERAVAHRELVAPLAELTGCSVEVAPGAPTELAPSIATARIRAAIDYRPASVLDALPALVAGYRQALSDGR